MTPIKFEEANKNLLKPQNMTNEECSSLWVFTDGQQYIQVKAIPIKSQTLCKNCYFNMHEHCQIRQNRSCEGCSMNITDHPYCECLKINLGKPCRHFKRREGVDNA